MKRLQKKRGAALWLTVLATLMLMTFFIGAVLNNARSQSGITTDELGEMQAHYAAMGAINQAFVYLEANPAWDGSWDYQPMPQNPETLHSLEVSRTQTWLGQNEVYLKAQGFTLAHGPGTPLAAVAGTAYRPEGGIQQAFLADEELDLENCIIDAYNSALGIGYVPVPSPAPTPFPTPTPGGTATFSGVPGSAPIGGNRELNLVGSNVDGKVLLPEAGIVLNGGTSNGQGAYLNSSGSTHGAIENPRAEFDLPAINPPFLSSPTTIIDPTSWATLAADPSEPGAKMLPPGAYQSVTVPEGGILTFQEGDYYFKDGFFAEATTTRIKLKLATENAPTKLFIGGQLRLNAVDFRPVDSGDPTASPPVPAPTQVVEPAALRIYGEGVEGPDDEMHCDISMIDTNFSGLIAGEAVEAQFQGCEIWGAVIGRTIDAQNVTVHYDTALGDVQLADYSRWRLRGLTRTL